MDLHKIRLSVRFRLYNIYNSNPVDRSGNFFVFDILKVGYCASVAFRASCNFVDTYLAK